MKNIDILIYFILFFLFFFFRMLKEVHIFSTTKQKPFFFSFFVCIKSIDCGYAKTLAFLFLFDKSVEFFFSS